MCVCVSVCVSVFLCKCVCVVCVCVCVCVSVRQASTRASRTNVTARTAVKFGRTLRRHEERHADDNPHLCRPSLHPYLERLDMGPLCSDFEIVIFTRRSRFVKLLKARFLSVRSSICCTRKS